MPKRNGSGLFQTSQAKPPIDRGMADAHLAVVRIVQLNAAGYLLRRPCLQQMSPDVVGQFGISILPGTPPVNSAAVQLVRWERAISPSQSLLKTRIALQLTADRAGAAA